MQHLWIIPALPLAGFVVTLLLGKRVLASRPEVVSLAAVTASWVLSMIVVVHVFGAHTRAIDFSRSRRPTSSATSTGSGWASSASASTWPRTGSRR